MTHCMTRRERANYLAQKKAQVLTRLQHLLATMTPEDARAMSPADQMLLAEVLQRLPADIPADVVAPLRAALAETEAAA